MKHPKTKESNAYNKQAWIIVKKLINPSLFVIGICPLDSQQLITCIIMAMHTRARIAAQMTLMIYAIFGCIWPNPVRRS